MFRLSAVLISGNSVPRDSSEQQHLSLKLAEIELVKREINDTPVLLLDDVLSELDSSRQNYLLEQHS